MTCPEYLRLRQDYEDALRRWARLMLLETGRLIAHLYSANCTLRAAAATTGRSYWKSSNEGSARSLVAFYSETQRVSAVSYPMDLAHAGK